MTALPISLAQRVQDIIRFSEWKDTIMTAVDVLTASIKAAEAKIDAAAALIPQLQTSVSNLQSQVAAMPDDSSVLESLVTELNQHIANLAAVLPAPATPAQEQTSSSTEPSSN